MVNFRPPRSPLEARCPLPPPREVDLALKPPPATTSGPPGPPAIDPTAPAQREGGKPSRPSYIQLHYSPRGELGGVLRGGLRSPAPCDGPPRPLRSLVAVRRTVASGAAVRTEAMVAGDMSVGRGEPLLAPLPPGGRVRGRAPLAHSRAACPPAPQKQDTTEKRTDPRSRAPRSEKWPLFGRSTPREAGLARAIEGITRGEEPP